MKRKLGSRPGWRRILASRYTVARSSKGDDGADGYTGVVSLYSIQRVAEPLWKPLAGEPTLLADAGFAWLQFYPLSAFSAAIAANGPEATYSVTAMIASTGTIAQWYVDICAGAGLTPEGVPWHDDLYLDLVTTGRGDIEVLDAHELDEALEAGEVSPDWYHAAWRAAHILAPQVRRVTLPEMRAAPGALAALRALERDERPEGFALLYRSP